MEVVRTRDDQRCVDRVTVWSSQSGAGAFQGPVTFRESYASSSASFEWQSRLLYYQHSPLHLRYLTQYPSFCYRNLNTSCLRSRSNLSSRTNLSPRFRTFAQDGQKLAQTSRLPLKTSLQQDVNMSVHGLAQPAVASQSQLSASSSSPCVSCPSADSWFWA